MVWKRNRRKEIEREIQDFGEVGPWRELAFSLVKWIFKNYNGKEDMGRV